MRTGWGVLCIAFASLFLSAAPTKALLVSLDAYIDLSGPPIYGPDGSTPLMDGSWVFIIGSGDNVNDGMAMVGTNLVAASVQGDDVILAAIQIPLNVGTNSGYFFTTTQYESDDINYTYIRFFDNGTNPLVGPLYWGTSDMFQLGVTLGVSTVNYNQYSNLVATNFNNFVIIPEPSTANLFVVVAGMLWAMRLHRRFHKRGDDDPGGGSDDTDPPQGRGGTDDLAPAQARPAFDLQSQTLYRQRAGPPDSAPVIAGMDWTHHPPSPS